MRRRLSFAATAARTVLAVALIAGVPGVGLTQTQPTQAPAKPAAEPDSASITIFAQRRPKAKNRAPQQTTISTQSASSCGFSTTLGEVMASGDPSQIQAYLNSDPSSQSYFQSMGVENPNAAIEALEGVDPLRAGSGFSSTSPYGNAAVGDTGTSDKVKTEDGAAGHCTAADAAAAAARSDIAQHDTSMGQAFDAMDAKDYAKALVYFKRGYDKLGYPEAAYMIGKIYLAGLGTPRDTKQAIVWFKRVANGAYDARDVMTFNPSDPFYKNARIDSDVILANIYMTGFDVPKSPKDARMWYAEAEKYGYIPADYMLGEMAQAGYGGAKDLKTAVAYYQKAGEYGFAPAQYQLGQLYYTGADGLAQDKTRAGAWLLRAARSGHPDALYAVGRMYELGEGGAKIDLPTALIYYKEAAIKGQIDAQVTLATYLYTGEGGAPKDLGTARKLFQAAAEQGDPDAMFNLGVMMVNGEGGPKDLVKAYCWFYIAQKGGVDKAGAALQELAGKMTADERAQAEALLNPKAAGK